MAMLGDLIRNIEEEQRAQAASIEDSAPALEDMNQDPPTAEGLENFRQDVPIQGGAPQEKIPLPIPVQVKSEEDGSNTFTILMNAFDNPKSHIAIMQLLASATEKDTIIFQISCVGGFIYSVLSVAAMVKSCKAKTVGVFSMIDSIESIILWLACKERRIAATPCMFIESIKYGNQGSVTDQLADSESTAFMQNDLLNDIVKAGIMTEEERADFCKHESVFSMFGLPLIERLKQAATE